MFYNIIIIITYPRIPFTYVHSKVCYNHLSNFCMKETKTHIYHKTFIFIILAETNLNNRGFLASNRIRTISDFSKVLHSCFQSSKFLSYGVTAAPSLVCNSFKCRLQSRNESLSFVNCSSAVTPSFHRGLWKYIKKS